MAFDSHYWLAIIDNNGMHITTSAALTAKPYAREWVTYNPLTATYDTPDGTSVAAELVDNVQCLADVQNIAAMRAKQRAATKPK